MGWSPGREKQGIAGGQAGPGTSILGPSWQGWVWGRAVQGWLSRGPAEDWLLVRTPGSNPTSLFPY